METDRRSPITENVLKKPQKIGSVLTLGAMLTPPVPCESGRKKITGLALSTPRFLSPVPHFFPFLFSRPVSPPINVANKNNERPNPHRHSTPFCRWSFAHQVGVVRGTKGKDVVASNRKPPTRGYGTLPCIPHPFTFPPPFAASLSNCFFPLLRKGKKTSARSRTSDRGFLNTRTFDVTIPRSQGFRLQFCIFFIVIAFFKIEM